MEIINEILNKKKTAIADSLLITLKMVVKFIFYRPFYLSMLVTDH